jgi:hypothetical protein
MKNLKSKLKELNVSYNNNNSNSNNDHLNHRILMLWIYSKLDLSNNHHNSHFRQINCQYSRIYQEFNSHSNQSYNQHSKSHSSNLTNNSLEHTNQQHHSNQPCNSKKSQISLTNSTRSCRICQT